MKLEWQTNTIKGKKMNDLIEELELITKEELQDLYKKEKQKREELEIWSKDKLQENLWLWSQNDILKQEINNIINKIGKK